VAVNSVAAFWAVAALLIITPGADWAFTISAGVRGRTVVPAVAGLVVGYAAMTVVVAAGVGALVAGSPVVLTGLTLVGGTYLVWHGASTFTHPSAPTAPTASSGAVPTAGWATVLRGAGVSGLNPKGLLIFLALLPQFTSRQSGWPVAGQLGLLGLVFTATCAVFYLGLGLFSRSVLHARPGAARAVGRLSGAAMVVIGAVLVAERLT
jgi:threonine/homoserine/homoserine lactone efflux protein